MDAEAVVFLSGLKLADTQIGELGTALINLVGGQIFRTNHVIAILDGLQVVARGHDDSIATAGADAGLPRSRLVISVGKKPAYAGGGHDMVNKKNARNRRGEKRFPEAAPRRDNAP